MEAVQHIDIRKTRGGELKPFVSGTRVAVENVYVCHELQGMSPDEIVGAYPHLSLGQVHAALAYYFEHAGEIRAQMKRSEEFVARMEAEQSPTRFTQLRDELLKDKEVHGDSVSP